MVYTLHTGPTAPAPNRTANRRTDQHAKPAAKPRQRRKAQRTNQPPNIRPTDRPNRASEPPAPSAQSVEKPTLTNAKSPMDRVIHRAIVFRRVERARPSERARQRLRQRYTASRKRPAPSDLPTSLWQPSRGLQRTGGLPPPVRHTRQPATATAHA